MGPKIKYLLAAMTVIIYALLVATLRASWFVLGLAVRFVLFFTVGAIFGMTLSRTINHDHDYA